MLNPTEVPRQHVDKKNTRLHYPSGFLNFETSTESHKKTRRM